MVFLGLGAGAHRWLLGARSGTRAELAGLLSAAGDGALAVAGLADLLGAVNVRLYRRLLKAMSR